MHIKTIRKEDKNKTNFQNPFEGDDNIENNFLKNYFPNITNQSSSQHIIIFLENKQIKGNFIENQKKIIKYLFQKKKFYGRKIYVIKGFYRNFLTLKGKFHHQSQITLNFGECI